MNAYLEEMYQSAETDVANLGHEVEELKAEIERLRAALQELRQELWNDGDGGPRYSGYLAIIDAALEDKP